ncbi:MAG: alpha/beta fold hydrolase [Saprospiraceae bacterium]|nr:alpha/beta fold hydrolase [Saprospiraceae bacterium]MBK7738619.1 alpha/beta fold hydrolase [Saprospiraceae bacterium]MBK7912809.1 alpha/beta fold hydrolase [Saprospiraceae bacterium]
MEQAEIINLHYKKTGQGPALIILHGLFGSLDNWQSLARLLSSDYTVYCLDLRNHGKSAHTDAFSFELMAMDVFKFIELHQLHQPDLIGHSMGGKVVLKMLSMQAQKLGRAMILDISPKSYSPGHDEIFRALFKLKLEELQRRDEADLILQTEIHDLVVRQFLLKNLDRKTDGGFRWKFNLKSLFQNYPHILEEIKFSQIINNEVCFVKGEYSNYIDVAELNELKKTFIHGQLIEIKAAGHWIHADQPLKLLEAIKTFFI